MPPPPARIGLNIVLRLVRMSGVRVNADAGNSPDSFISKFRNANNVIWAIFCRSIGLKKFQNDVIQNNDIVHQF